MSEVVISVENISKQYRLGKVGSKSLSHDLNRLWHRITRKDDPYSQAGEVNDRTTRGNSDYVWSLKDISFDVYKGDVLGIIGKNGAGKSTLLKILAQVTSPSQGKVKLRGRVASLLEVGTGFHPDLSGRENIFLNGAILGMTKKEIRSKLDEIIDFSGVERYIDTPVKRYSSGMYVRLAFAVAAHLEPEILIIDEVLAVGDAEFQKKCLGKMKDVSGQGRTVLFVSHNMASMNQLCTRGVFLKHGQVAGMGTMQEVIPLYLSDDNGASALKGEVEYAVDPGKRMQVIKASVLDRSGRVVDKPFSVQDEVFFNISYLFNDEVKKCNLTLIIQNAQGETVWFIDRTDYHKTFFVAEKGKYSAQIKLPNPLLKPGQYFVTIGLGDAQSADNDHRFSVLKFEISGVETLRNMRQGSVYLPLQWEMVQQVQ